MTDFDDLSPSAQLAEWLRHNDLLYDVCPECRTGWSLTFEPRGPRTLIVSVARPYSDCTHALPGDWLGLVEEAYGMDVALHVRPPIWVSSAASALAPKALETLASWNGFDPELFRQDRAFVHVIDGELQPLSSVELRLKLAATADWRAEFGSADPPLAVVKMVEALGPSRAIPEIGRIVNAPVLMGDGALLLRPGYDPASKLYYAPPEGLLGLEVPQPVAWDDVRAARTLLLEELLGDFPLRQRRRQGERACLRADPVPTRLHRGGDALLPDRQACARHGRGSARGRRDDPDPGQGAGFDAVVGEGGRVPQGAPRPAQVGSGCRQARQPHRPRQLRPSQLCVDRGRVLRPGTGLKPDRLLSRALRLDRHREQRTARQGFQEPRRPDPARCESGGARRRSGPGEGESWKHHNLRAWAKEQRGELVRACLVLCRWWVQQGMDRNPPAVPLGSFEDYAAVLNGVLSSAGGRSFLRNLDTLEAGDEEAIAVGVLFRRWRETYEEEVAAREVLADGKLRRALADAGAPTDDPQKFGMWLGSKRDAVYGGLVLRRRHREDGNRWLVVPV